MCVGSTQWAPTTISLPAMVLQHSPLPWSCSPAVCQWPGCPHPGPGSAGSCLAQTLAQGSLGLSDASQIRSPWRPIQSLGLHPDLGEGDRKLSPGVPRGEPALLLTKAPLHASTAFGDAAYQGRRHPACPERHVPSSMSWALHT